MKLPEPTTDDLEFRTCGDELASFPGPAQLSSLEVRKSDRGPGIFYHVSDVEGREKVERT